jgi:hypothetical protein
MAQKATDCSRVTIHESCISPMLLDALPHMPLPKVLRAALACAPPCSDQQQSRLQLRAAAAAPVLLAAGGLSLRHFLQAPSWRSSVQSVCKLSKSAGHSRSVLTTAGGTVCAKCVQGMRKVSKSARHSHSVLTTAGGIVCSRCVQSVKECQACTQRPDNG